MSLRDRLHEEMTAATRSGDVLRRDTLRMVWSAVYAVEKRDHAVLDDDQALAVLAREVKTRRESVEAYRKGGREDLVAKEEAEIAIIAGYLPAALSEAEIDALVEEAITATGAASGAASAPAGVLSASSWFSHDNFLLISFRIADRPGAPHRPAL